uniref:SWIM-type domain-containing protein n=1 Tax=Clytia hemisphaerica TaxID=252671 RepID=A0A7M5WUR1_9CNID
MCYAQNEKDFVDLENKFLDLGCPSLTEYYEKNWRPISNEWVKCFKAKSGDFLNSTNNRLESFNSKLKSLLGHRSSLNEFVRGFFTVLSAIRSERDKAAADEFLKSKTLVPENTTVAAIRSHLTSYAADFVCQELAAVSKTVVRNSTNTSCDCCFHQSMRLPCRHIFLTRSLAGLSIYD